MSMYADEHFVKSNSVGNKLQDIQQEDAGCNIIYRPVRSANGSLRNKRIVAYSSGGMGSRIRDAESGQYYCNRVGSRDEDLFYTVIMATGECNKFNTLFYLSPQHYMNHMVNVVIDQDHIDAWESKRDARLRELQR